MAIGTKKFVGFCFLSTRSLSRLNPLFEGCSNDIVLQQLVPNGEHKFFESVARISMRHAVNYLSFAAGPIFLRGWKGATFVCTDPFCRYVKLYW